MFLLFVFVYSLAGPYSSLPSANAGAPDEGLTTAKPRNINEVHEQILKYIKQDYNLPYQQNIALNVHAVWNLKAAQVEDTLTNDLTNVKNELGNTQLELDRVKVKLTLRNEVHNQFSIISPVWLRYLPIKMKFKWQILLQMESEITERLKSIITNQMNITVDQFCNDMDVFEEQATRDIHRDDFPDLESEDKMMNILQSIGFKKGTIKKSIVALAFHFRNLNNTAYCKDDYKYYFLYFPSVQTGTSVTKIVDFMNLYFGHDVVYNQNVTIIGNDRTEEGARPTQHFQAFVRLNKTITKQDGKEINVLSVLKQIEEEIRVQKIKRQTTLKVKSTGVSKVPAATISKTKLYSQTSSDNDLINRTESKSDTTTFGSTTEMMPLKKSFMDKCGENGVPLIYW